MPRPQKTDAKPPSQVYRFKITLHYVEPAIWRQIEIPDGTLDQFHEQIQTAMGWTNSHLHDFEIGGRRYGDPELLDDGWGDGRLIDSTETLLSELLKKRRKSFRFLYEYDFGDGWEHEIVYEGTQPAEKGVKYPRCVAGARACPPEDVGGPGGYLDFLEAIRDPKHESHEDYLEWIGEEFDAERFNADEASKAMRRGVPRWRIGR